MKQQDDNAIADREPDGHGPAHECTYQQCGNPESPNACPFVKDASASDSDPVNDNHNHQHSYVLACSCGDIKAITPSNAQHGITSHSNRGDWHPE